MVSSPTTTGTDSTADSSDNSENNMNDIYKMFVSKKRDRSTSDLRVPSWLPWLPTRSQVERLKVAELKEACEERGLTKSGKKAELQSRIISWTANQHLNRVENRRSKKNMPFDYYQSIRRTSSSRSVADNSSRRQKLDSKSPTNKKQQSPRSETNIKKPYRIMPLRNNQKENDDDETPLLPTTSTSTNPPLKNNKAYMDSLTRTFFHQNTTYSNIQVKNLYAAAKRADQAGDRRASQQILRQLLDATPHDGRVLSRLARLSNEEGNVGDARRYLQAGCRTHPRNAHFWHSLGVLELDGKNVETARRCFKKAIEVDPSLARAYHAWGRYEHSQGNIRLAMSLFKKGVRFSPRNHRLHHALGGLYREAGMLREAYASFQKGMKYGPPWGQPFLCTSLAYVTYEMEGVDAARRWLWRGVDLNAKHAQGWLALAQLEESEGRYDIAERIYWEAVEGYERERMIHSKGKGKKRPKPKRSGDMWISVYNSWARMEEARGNVTAADDVYARAAKVFSNEWRIYTNWAQCLARMGQHAKTRLLYKKACRLAGTSYAEPYQLHAEYEISQNNHLEARAILYLGALFNTNNPEEGQPQQERTLASLFHTWALLESKLDNPTRAETLFDYALRLTKTGDDNRAKYLASLAQFEYSRENYRLAQHAIILCINDDYGKHNPKHWRLWADIAEKIGDDRLMEQCRDQIKSLMNGSMVGNKADLRDLLCKAPWHRKIFNYGEVGI